MRRVMKWTVLVNDKYHKIGVGPVVHVESQYRKFDEVQVWTLEECNPAGNLIWAPSREAIVVGTGHPVPDFVDPIGSVVAEGGRLVWHVFATPK